MSMTAAKRRKGVVIGDKGWYHVAWAFLKVSWLHWLCYGEGRGEAVYLWDKLAIGCKHPIVRVKISRLELN